MVDDDDGVESPSPEPRTDSRSALPREIRAGRRLRVIKCDETSSMIFSPRDGIYGVGVEVGGASGGPRDRGRAQGGGRAPHPHGQGVAPLTIHRPQLQLHIFMFGEKKSRKRIHHVLRYGAAAKP